MSLVWALGTDCQTAPRSRHQLAERAGLCAAKVLLAKHKRKYVPVNPPDAIEQIMTQAELLADTWAEDRSLDNA